MWFSEISRGGITKEEQGRIADSKPGASATLDAWEFWIVIAACATLLITITYAFVAGP